MRWMLVALAVGFAVVLVACGENSDVESRLTMASPNAPVFELADVIDALSGVAATVEQRGRVPAMPFSVPGRRLAVDAFEIDVREYADVVARAEEEGTIAMGGWSVNNTPVEWIASPHYWSRGRVIVLYLGDNPRAIDLLNSTLGPAIDP